MRIFIDVNGKLGSQSAVDQLVPHHLELFRRIRRMFRAGDVTDYKEAIQDFKEYERAILNAQHHCDAAYARQLEMPELVRGHSSYGTISRNWAANVIKGLEDTTVSRHELSKILRGLKHYRSKK